jgi:hypothetical protein
MRKLKLILAVACIGFIGSAGAQTKLQKKMQAKIDKMNAKASSGKYTTYDYTDDSGISGTYFVTEKIYKNHATVGFNYAREKGGEIVNEMKVEFGDYQTMTFRQKEKYKTKHSINYFYTTVVSVTGISVNDHWRLVEIGKNIFAFVHDSDEKVMSVVAKDSSVLGDYDIETAQVLFDQKMAIINREKMDKETATWKKSPVYAKNIDKIVFATEDHHLMKRGYTNKPPMVTGKDFKTVLDMAGNMNYMAFFQYPPSMAFPGMEINIEYEMGGKKTSRTEYRAKSAAWSKMVPRVETSKFAYRQHAPRSLRTYNSYYSQYVQDYAFMQVLYMNKDKFMIGNEYPLTVKMYVSRDGENGELIAEGVVNLLYSPSAYKMYEGDEDHPEKKSVWTEFEEFLEE